MIKKNTKGGKNLYKDEDRRKGEIETKIMNVLADVMAGKIKLKRAELEESDAPALHRAIGGSKDYPFCDYFRALRGLRALLHSSSSIFGLVKEIIDTAHWRDLHKYHDRRAC